MTRFSVVIPVRNGANYLEEALASVVSQTDDRFSAIVLDDCSDDATGLIAGRFHDRGVRLLPSARRLGIEGNWSRILDLDLEEYVTILSHDDLLYPEFLAEVAGLIEQNPTASLFQTHFDLIDRAGHKLRICRPMPLVENGDQFLAGRHAFGRDSYGSGYVARSEDFRRVGGMPAFPRLLFADDVLWYRLAQLDRIVRSPSHCCAIRVHPGSEAHAATLPEVYDAARLYLEALASAGYLSKPRHEKLARQYVQAVLIARHRRRLVSLLRQSDPGALATYQRELAGMMAAWDDRASFQMRDQVTELLRRLVSSRLPRQVRLLLASAIEAVADMTKPVREAFHDWQR